ncbi:MAG: class I SAM-dependent methyltransferase [Cyanobacteria bacterium P01_G01_bin.49]
MKQKDLNQEWINLSQAWITEARKGKNSNRNGLLDQPMLIACGDVTGKKIIDCGCGEGRFCRILAARGANYVLGIDLCEPMIEAARKLQSETDEYRVADVQDISFMENEMFDLAVSYLNQCDVPNLHSNNREVHRILKKAGRFIVANLHPMRSAVGAWHKSNSGKKEHVILDRYFDEGDRTWKMMGSEFTNFHRTLSTYISSFLTTGFTIEGIVEPTVSGKQLKDYPDLEDELRVPTFIIYILKKI